MYSTECLLSHHPSAVSVSRRLANNGKSPPRKCPGEPLRTYADVCSGRAIIQGLRGTEDQIEEVVPGGNPSTLTRLEQWPRQRQAGGTPLSIGANQEGKGHG